MPLPTLKKYWKYEAFRPLQQEIVQSVLDGHDTFVLLPTGGGKSICYQVPALILPGFCLVISPLIALMHDQVERLKSMKIPAVYFHSGLSKREIEIELQNLRNGKYKLAYISPERIQSERFISHLPYLNINFVAVDEAHCISQWGYDFRPAYIQIQTIRETKPKVPIIALTASATPKVQDDIKEKLQLQTVKVFTATFHRPNLNYKVVHTQNKRAYALQQCLLTGGSGIVYAGSRGKVVELTRWFKQEGVSCDFYHAGVPSAKRNEKQEAWLRGEFPLMICTNAFGMGIDKPNVRHVIHYTAPNSLEAYYQEAGRAGRDEKPANCILMYDEGDMKRDQIFMAQQYPTLTQVQQVYQAIGNYVQLALHSGNGSSFPFDLAEFCSRFSFRPVDCHYALKQLEMLGYVTLSDAVLNPAKVKIRMDSLTLYDFQLKNARFEPLIKFLLRSYGGIYEQFVSIQTSTIAGKLALTKPVVEAMLKELDKLKILYFLPSSEGSTLTFLTPRVDQIVDHERRLEKLQKASEERLKMMHNYINAETCRSKLISSYFGERLYADCEKCDVCRLKRRNLFSVEKFSQISDQLKISLAQAPMPAKIVLENLKNTDLDSVKDVMRWLLDDGVLVMNEERKLYWKK